MKVKTEIDVWQFNPKISHEFESFISTLSNCKITCVANKYPKWLDELNPTIYITTCGIWNPLSGDGAPYKLHLKIGNKYDFTIKPYDYIIRCKNKEIIMMTQKDFESLFGKSNF